MTGTDGFDLYVGDNAPPPLPEPGTLLLAAAGLPLVTFARRRLAS